MLVLLKCTEEKGIAQRKRNEAIKNKLQTYFTGFPCRYGHTSLRLTSNYRCLKCLELAKDKIRIQKRENSKKLRKKNPEKIREQERQKRSRKRGQYNSYGQKYKLKKKHAVPKWADTQKIKEIYQNCPVKHHVDHIIPIQGNLISGLHVENNLQYLKAIENLIKGNHFKPYREKDGEITYLEEKYHAKFSNSTN